MMSDRGTAAAALCKRFQKAAEMVVSAEEYFAKVCSGIGADLIATWKEEIEIAEQARLKDPAAMDVMKARVSQSHGAAARSAAAPMTAVEGWIHLGVSLERKQ